VPLDVVCPAGPGSEPLPVEAPLASLTADVVVDDELGRTVDVVVDPGTVLVGVVATAVVLLTLVAVVVVVVVDVVEVDVVVVVASVCSELTTAAPAVRACCGTPAMPVDSTSA
jgi:hypothetical protein